MATLTEAQIRDARASLQRKGFCMLKNYFSEDEGKSLDTIARSFVANESLVRVKEANKPDMLCRVEEMIPHSSDLNALVQARVQPAIDAITGTQYRPFKDKLNFKWPGGGAFPPHQDFPAYSPFKAPYHVTAMLGIDPQTFENGCLFVASDYRTELGIKGHALEILPYTKGGPNHGNIVDSTAKKLSWTPLLTTPRDLVLFDSYVPHYSEPNGSKTSRRLILITFSEAKYGDQYSEYYKLKRADPQNPVFHFATPTVSRAADVVASVSKSAKL